MTRYRLPQANEGKEMKSLNERFDAINLGGAPERSQAAFCLTDGVYAQLYSAAQVQTRNAQ